MGAPLLIPAAGAVAGALLKPNNPLQGALLGAAAGYTGGQALGLTGVAPTAAAGLNPAATAGIDATSKFGSYLNTTGANASLLNPAISAGVPNTQFGNYLNNAGANAVPQAVTNTAPSFMDKFSMMGKSAYENPMMTSQALSATTSLLSPDQSQMPSAPTVPITKGQLKDYNPMASMDPYKQSVIGSPQISLI